MGLRIFLVCTLFAVSACSPGAAVVMAGANLVTLVNSDKMLSDHAVSYVTGEDCSLVAASQGEDYCRAVPAETETPEDPPEAGQMHCYRTLGEITCYEAPDRLASESARVH